MNGSLTSQESDSRMVYSACACLDLLGVDFEEMSNFKVQYYDLILKERGYKVHHGLLE